MVRRHFRLIRRDKIPRILFEPSMSGVTAHFFFYPTALAGVPKHVAKRLVGKR